MFKPTRNILKEKFKESLTSVLPIATLVFIICFLIVPVPNSALLAFIFGAMLLVIGMGLFTLGTDMAMTPIGEYVGNALTRSRKIWLVALVGFILGILITVAEPDLQVLAEQVPGVPNIVLIMAVAIGVGLFLVVALLRILFKVQLKFIIAALYIATFVLAQFVPKSFLAVAFDSGGVTTGPMTVPFILALGVGVSAIRSDKNAESDSFGLVALCSIGPILAVMILGLIFRPDQAAYTSDVLNLTENSRELGRLFISSLPYYLIEVLVALAPIIAFFLIFQFTSLHLKKRSVARIMIGITYTYIGLTVFLLGVNVGFMPLGNYLGQMLGALDFNWILVPLGMVIGYFTVSAEPAVHVLSKQVYEITAGAIPKKALSTCLSIGVAVSVGLAMLRILLGIPIMYLLIPGYAIAMLMMIVSPDIFTAIAFDSGGVASGPMTATFILPLAMGVCSATGGDISADAFGVVAMVAMTPLITIQALGIYFRIKQRGLKSAQVEALESLPEDDIIEL